jgi:hypothetical protein
MFDTYLICYQRPKAGYETQGLHSSSGHVDLDNKIMNRKRPILKSGLNIPMSCIAFIGYQNYVKYAQAFYWFNPLRKSLAQLFRRASIK